MENKYFTIPTKYIKPYIGLFIVVAVMPLISNALDYFDLFSDYRIVPILISLFLMCLGGYLMHPKLGLFAVIVIALCYAYITFFIF